jgi:hypothetical protein
MLRLALTTAAASSALGADPCLLSDEYSTTVSYSTTPFTDNACNHLQLARASGYAGLGVRPDGAGWLAGGLSCGDCVRVTNANANSTLVGATIDVQVVDLVSDSALSLDADSFEQVFGPGAQGVSAATFARVSCSGLDKRTNEGNLQYRFKFGSRSADYPKIYYLGVSIVNHRTPLTAVQVRNSGETAWRACPYNGANGYCFPTGITSVPFEVRVTGHAYANATAGAGEFVVVDTIASLPPCTSEDECDAAMLNSTLQLPEPQGTECAPPSPSPTPAPPTPPTPAPPPTPPPVRGALPCRMPCHILCHGAQSAPFATRACCALSSPSPPSHPPCLADAGTRAHVRQGLLRWLSLSRPGLVLPGHIGSVLRRAGRDRRLAAGAQEGGAGRRLPRHRHGRLRGVLLLRRRHRLLRTHHPP